MLRVYRSPLRRYGSGMAQPIAFTPPRLSSRSTGPVRRRILFYLPGYDPNAGRRYRTLFVREIHRYAKYFSIKPPQISRAVMCQDGQVQTWTVEAGIGEGRTHTSYEILLWDDIVRCDMARPHLTGAWLNALALLHVAATGTLFRLYRASWKCGNVILYPFTMTLLLPAAVLLLAAASHGVLSVSLGLPAEIAITLGLWAGLYLIWKSAPWLERAFLWQLMHDWVFNWQHARGRRADYSARLNAFADHALSRIREAQADEVLLVGHSTGALTAVELAARLLARDERLGCEGPALSLLTVGSSLPIVAMQPSARVTRAEIKSLVISQRLVWVDYQAPQDWMNFPGFNPVHDLGLGVPLAEAANPVIRSAKFREIIGPETYRQIRARPFRMHFQFLMANEHAGAFDIFALSLGNQCLRDRLIGDKALPLGGAGVQVQAGPPVGSGDRRNEAGLPL